ncbi:MAG: hypothetical protein PF689_14520 [Deltaproteobacteria bacterium]|jgi:hypothetical protein|nr:hypothetical protein [Deltaproteobacteria bacterium]
MKPRLFIKILPILVLLISCKNTENNNDFTDNKQKTVVKKQNKNSKIPLQKEKIVYEGNVKVLNASINPFGKTDHINAGQAIPVFFKIKGFSSRYPLTGSLEIANSQRTVLVQKTEIYRKGKSTGKVIMAGLSTTSSLVWPEGKYTLLVKLEQPETKRSLKLYLPFKLKNSHKPSNRFNISKIIFPKFTAAASQIHLWLLLENPSWKKSKEKYQAEMIFKWTVNNSEYKHLISLLNNHQPKIIWHKITLNVPAETGKTPFIFSFQEKHSKKKIKIWKNVEIYPTNSLLHNIHFYSPGGEPQNIWHRQDSGFLTFNSGFSEVGGKLDLAVIDRQGEIHLVKKGIKVKAQKLKGPFSIPEFFPSGKFTVKLRLQTKDKTKERHLKSLVSGKRFTYSTRMKAQNIKFYQDQYFPLNPSGFLKSNQNYNLSFILSGFKNKKIAKSLQKNSQTHKYNLIKVGAECQIQLTAPLESEPAVVSRLGKVNRTTLHGVPRLRFNSSWKLPQIKPGRYIMRLNCQDLNSDRASQTIKTLKIK